MAFRAFSTSARRLLEWAGYPRELLPKVWIDATKTYSERGAIAKVGQIQKIEILYRDDGSDPVHQSSYNPKDKEFVLRARVTPKDGKPIVHHIYKDGTGTRFVADKRE